MSTGQSTHATIKATIRSHTSDTPAFEREVKTELREEFNDFAYVCNVYERLRKHGEIYSYEKNGDRIVKITDDQP